MQIEAAAIYCRDLAAAGVDQMRELSFQLGSPNEHLTDKTTLKLLTKKEITRNSAETEAQRLTTDKLALWSYIRSCDPPDPAPGDDRLLTLAGNLSWLKQLRWSEFTSEDSAFNPCVLLCIE